jgi:hypothetical protein
MKNELNTCFQQKFATGSYGVEIGRAWCSWKACEICSSLVQKKKLKKNNFSSHDLPKQQSTIFWSQGILGVKLKPFSGVVGRYLLVFVDVAFYRTSSVPLVQECVSNSKGGGLP